MSATERDAYNEVFPTRLRQLMREKNLTQQALATAIGAKRQSISQYMDGSVQPVISKLKSMAEHFEVTADYLLGLSDTRTPDIDAQGIIAKTHLSEQAVKSLLWGAASFNGLPEYASELLPMFLPPTGKSMHTNIWHYYMELLDARDKASALPDDFPEPSPEASRYCELTPKDAVKLYAHLIARDVETIFENGGNVDEGK